MQLDLCAEGVINLTTEDRGTVVTFQDRPSGGVTYERGVRVELYKYGDILLVGRETAVYTVNQIDSGSLVTTWREVLKLLDFGVEAVVTISKGEDYRQVEFIPPKSTTPKELRESVLTLIKTHILSLLNEIDKQKVVTENTELFIDDRGVRMLIVKLPNHFPITFTLDSVDKINNLNLCLGHLQSLADALIELRGALWLEQSGEGYKTLIMRLDDLGA